ncbi:MAG: prephenate dehydrogenase [Anaerolineales bacterium]
MSEEGHFTLTRSRVAIIGLGLMGGSLALALRGRCAAIYGIDTDPAALELACRQDIVDRTSDDAASLLPQADVVILAAPVLTILDILDRLPSLTPNPCIVLDLGSTKRRIVEAMGRLPERFDPVGGHPICGKERLSLANAERTLYYTATFILTPLQRTSERALSAANQIIEAVGAKATILEAAAHDRILASASHVPFLASSALALAAPTEVAPFAGPGFRSASRLAGTPMSMMLGVLESNKDNVLDALHRLQSHLAALETALAADDPSRLESILNDAQSKYRAFTR